MSIRAMRWAVEVEDIGSTEKSVLLVLAWHADNDGNCFPSHIRIAKKACCGYSTAKAALNKLKARGLLTWVSQYRHDGGKASNVYRLAVEDPSPNPGDPSAEEQRHPSPNPGDPSAEEQRHPSPNPGDKRSGEPPGKENGKGPFLSFRESWKIRKDLEAIETQIAGFKKSRKNWSATDTKPTKTGAEAWDILKTRKDQLQYELLQSFNIENQKSANHKTYPTYAS